MANGRSFVTSFLTKYNNSAINQFQSQLKDLKKEMSDNKREQKELSKEIRDAQKEYNLIQKQIKQTGQATEEQKKRLDELTNSINTDKEALERLKVQQAAIQSKINDTNTAIDKQNKAYSEMVKSMEGAKTAGADLAKQMAAITAAATAAVAGLFAFTSEAALWADDVNTLSTVTGIGTAELQKFMYASDLIDVSVETLSGSLKKLVASMSTAAENAGSGAALAFRELGVSVTDSTGAIRDRQEVFYETIDALGRIGNETERDALAMDIFGKSATELNPLILGGAEALKEIGDEAERAGLILSQEALDGLNGFNDKLDLLKSKGTAIKHLAASEMTPALDGLLEVADELLDEINKMVQSGELREIAETLGNSIKRAADDLKNVIKFVWDYRDAIAAAVKGMIAFKLSMSISGVITSVVNVFKALTTTATAAAAATSAFGAAMSKLSAVGAVISVVVGLTTAFISLCNAAEGSTEVIDEYNRKVEAANDKAKAYTATLTELREKTESVVSPANAEAEVIKLLQAEYDDLRKKTELTASEKDRLAGISEKLAGKLGITTGALRDQTGVYKDLSKEIDTYLDKLTKQAKYEYFEDTIKEAVRSSEELSRKIKEQGIALGEARIKLVEMEREFEKQGRMSRDKNGYYYFDSEAQEELKAQRDIIEQLTLEYNAYKRELDSVNDVLEDAKADYQNYLDSLNESSKKTDEAAESTKDYVNAQKDLQTQSSSLRSEMSSLANTLGKLEQGEALNLSTVLDLIEKYPEYAGELLSAGDNADLQRIALEKLFEAKKAEYILTQQSAIDNIEASNKETEAIIENSRKQMKARAMAVGGKWDTDIDEFIDRRFANELDQIKKNSDELEAYKKKIEAVSNIRYSDFVTASDGDSKASSSGSSSSEKSKWTMNGRGVYASGDSYVSTYLQWIDRVLTLGRMTEQEEEKLLAELLRREKNTAEERFQVEQRLYKLRESLAKETAEKAAAAEKEKQEKLLEGQNRALAALRRLISSKKELYDEEAKKAQETADKEIAALDKAAEARKRDNDDRKRQQELDRINAKLQYSKLGELERIELERRRQDILNEQHEVNYERSIEAQREAIRAGANRTVSASETAKAALDAKYSAISDRVAYLNGTETYDQWAARQPASVNVTYVINGLSADQVAAKTTREIMKELGGVT